MNVAEKYGETWCLHTVAEVWIFKSIKVYSAVNSITFLIVIQYLIHLIAKTTGGSV